MKILLKDMKKGVIKVFPTSQEDLWLLGQLIGKGALASAKTTRKIKISETKTEKKTYYSTISVENAIYENDSLRISGTIVSEHDDIPKGGHHSLSISVNNDLKIEQKWLKYQVEKLEESTKQKANVLLSVLDRESVYFATMEESGYRKLSCFEGDVEKKADGAKASGGFYREIADKMRDYDTRFNFDRIVVASPAFFKDDFMKFVSDPGLKKKIILATCSSVSENAFDELMKRPEVKSALAQQRIQQEVVFVDELFVEISKDGKYCYGFEDVKERARAGAVELLLVTTGLIFSRRENGSFEELEQIMGAVEEVRGRVMIINSGNDAGKKLDGIFGIGAILRYKC
jgi:protein pelota